MTAFVLDARSRLLGAFEDEATDATDRLLEQLQSETARFPALWHLEVANVLALAERRTRITPAETAEFIALLGALMINVDEETPSRAFASGPRSWRGASA